MEYVQEEEDPTQFLGEEEKQQVSLLVSGIFWYKPLFIKHLDYG